jgi:hypothetical protein
MTSTYRGRRAASIENAQVRLTVLLEGGHIAEVLDKRSGINPLWTPQWDSIEPSTFETSRHASYSGASDGPLLAGIMGHNLCLDIFGGPSPEEAAAGLTAHGEASVVPYTIEADGSVLNARAELRQAGLTVTRRIALHGSVVEIAETLTNLTACDRPVGWTQHVTLGPPFLKNGVTEFRASATRSKVVEGTFGPADYLAPGATFDWPHAPRARGGIVDLQLLHTSPQARSSLLRQGSNDYGSFFATRNAWRYAFVCATVLGHENHADVCGNRDERHARIRSGWRRSPARRAATGRPRWWCVRAHHRRSL